MWLVPDRSASVYARLRRLIVELAQRFGTPPFDPHVTLLGGLDAPLGSVRRDLARLAPSLRPCEIRLGEVVSRGEYFQRLVAVVESTPDVTAAHERAKAVFAGHRPAYRPHLSLAYGSLTEAQTAVLCDLANASGVMGTRFTPAGLELWRTDGPVEAWVCVAALRLGPANDR